MNGPSATPRRRGRIVWPLVLALLATLVLLFLFNPAEHAFYPRCGFRKLTGLDCPGCGGLRATHQLLRGNVAAAFTLNPLLCLLAPAAVWLLARATHRRLTEGGEFRLGWRPGWTWTLGAVVIVFWILRNVSVIHSHAKL